MGLGGVLVAWIVGVALSAAAEPSYLESPALATRAEAVARLDIVREAGCDGRIVRRFVQSEGWRFVVRLEGDGAEPPPAACSHRLVAPTGSLGEAGPEEVLDDEGIGEDDSDVADLHEGDADFDAEPEPTAMGEGTTPAMSTSTGGDAPRGERRPGSRDAVVRPEEVLARLLRRHRGVREPAPLGDLVFRFRRTTSDGRVVDHVYARRGDDRYLAVDVVEGRGRSSRAGIVGGCPWYDGPTSHPLDAEATRVAVERFSPESVLALTTSLLGAAPDLPEPAMLRVERPAGEQVVRLSSPGDRATPPVRLDLALPEWRLSVVSRGPVEAAIDTRYADWFELDGGALLPRHLQVVRGAAVLDEVRIDEVETAPTWLPEWFPDCDS